MGCNCKWTEIVIGLVILIFTIWPGIIGVTASWWVIVIAAIVLILHAFMCKPCSTCAPSADISKTVTKKQAKKKR